MTEILIEMNGLKVVEVDETDADKLFFWSIICGWKGET